MPFLGYADEEFYGMIEMPSRKQGWGLIKKTPDPINVLTIGGFAMWRHHAVIVLLFVALVVSGCSLDPTPKRLKAYLPPPGPASQVNEDITRLSSGEIAAVLVVLNDTGFKKSAPALRQSTLHNLGEHLKAEVEKQLPIRFSDLILPEDLTPENSTDFFIQQARERDQPYVMVAVLSSTERETFAYLSMHGDQGGGMPSPGMPGYQTENHARMELALLDGRSGRPVLMTDGQAWAILERLQVPIKSNIYPVVRRDVLQPPIFPKSERDAYETLMWVSGREAIAQAVMRLGIALEKHQSVPRAVTGSGRRIM